MENKKLYLVKFTERCPKGVEPEVFYKVGITKQSIYDRFSYVTRYDVKEIESFNIHPVLAEYFEFKFIKEMVYYKHQPKFHISGYSECFKPMDIIINKFHNLKNKINESIDGISASNKIINIEDKLDLFLAKRNELIKEAKRVALEEKLRIKNLLSNYEDLTIIGCLIIKYMEENDGLDLTTTELSKLFKVNSKDITKELKILNSYGLIIPVKSINKFGNKIKSKIIYLKKN